MKLSTPAAGSTYDTMFPTEKLLALKHQGAVGWDSLGFNTALKQFNSIYDYNANY